jgi:hypothetical protein
MLHAPFPAELVESSDDEAAFACHRQALGFCQMTLLECALPEAVASVEALRIAWSID